MGPFVPEFISPELNYIIALLLGISFGFILEQAGFSASRKLAGLFYGYDFTVLKVFFTAAIVAGIGITMFNYYGILDIDLIYVNPTYLPSAIIGGGIMGLGFIIGGFCPGTSISAFAIGKIDAMFYVFGIIIGIFLFTISYPLIETTFKAGNSGGLLVYDSLGLSKGLFVFLLIIMAIGAFFFATYMEKRVNKAKDHPEKIYYKKYFQVAFLVILIGFVYIFRPDWKTKIAQSASLKAATAENVSYMTSDELAFKLLNNYKDIELIDVRSVEDFKKSNIPTAVNIPISDITERQWYDFIRKNNKSQIFYSRNETDAIKAYFVAREFDHNHGFVLKGGFDHFTSSIMDPSGIALLDTTTNLQGKWDYRFRAKARRGIEDLQKKLANQSKPKKKPVVKVVGGC